jgi:hypothetical protein
MRPAATMHLFLYSFFDAAVNADTINHASDENKTLLSKWYYEMHVICEIFPVVHLHTVDLVSILIFLLL